MPLPGSINTKIAVRRLLILVLLFASLCPACSQGPLRKGPYLIYPGDNTKMQVLWQLTETAACRLEWGLDDNCSLGSFETSEYGSDHQHAHTISGLTPSTKYYYRITGPYYYYTGSFYTAPADSATTLKFMVYGDTRTYPAVHNVVAASMIRTYLRDPDFRTIIVGCGDLVTDGRKESDWNDQLFRARKINIRRLLANMPMQWAVGNHEMPGDIFVKYFPYPYVEDRYWSFDYGPAHFVMVDQYVDYSPGSRQYSWLEKDLAATTKAWKFIFLHEPGWSAGGHPNNVAVQEYLQPLCEKYDVAILFAGHNHYYARAIVDNVHHVTTAGGGAPLRAPDPGHPNIVATSRSYHFCRLEISCDSLSFVAVDTRGRVIDRLALRPNRAVTDPRSNTRPSSANQLMASAH